MEKRISIELIDERTRRYAATLDGAIIMESYDPMELYHFCGGISWAIEHLIL